MKIHFEFFSLEGKVVEMSNATFNFAIINFLDFVIRKYA